MPPKGTPPLSPRKKPLLYPPEGGSSVCLSVGGNVIQEVHKVCRGIREVERIYVIINSRMECKEALMAMQEISNGRTMLLTLLNKVIKIV